MVRLLTVLSLGISLTEQAAAQIAVEYDPDEPHHLSLFTGGTHLPTADETGFTIGLDYEYRLNRLIGIGAVAERAFGQIDSTTLLAVVDIHVWRGFAFQLGPGIELTGNETFALGRIGGLYEFEFGPGLTVSPQIHYDASGTEDGLVFGLAFGMAF